MTGVQVTVSTAEAALITGYSKELIRQAVGTGRLLATKVGGNLRIDRSVLVAWVESRDTYQTRSRSFWAKVAGDDPMGCWLWQGTKTLGGYGMFGPAMAHRWSYEAMVGLIPEGLHIDHLCSVRACVNPYHLDPVTPRVNVQRSRPTRSTHCNHGHEFTAANTYWLGRKRTCRECNRIASVYKNAQKAGVLGPLSTERRFYRRLVTA